MLSRPYYNEADSRKRQIDTLKIFNDNVVKVQENVEYRVDFVAAGCNMSLDIILGPEFPNERPTILINPSVSHPWIAENSNIVIGAPGLINFTIHSDLGRVVQAIIREFSRSQFVVDNSVNAVGTTSPLSVCSLTFPDLNDMTIEELQELGKNADLQDRFLGINPQLVELDRAIEEVLSNIETIAKENLGKRRIMDDFKTELLDRISTIVQLKSNYEELNKKHQKLSEAYDPYKIRDSLQEAASKADGEAELLAEQFLAGSIPVDAFLAQYAEKRALGQSRKTRGDRLAHQLEQLDKATL